MKNILSIAALAALVSAGAGAANAGTNLVQDGSFATTTSNTFYSGVGDNQFWGNIGYYNDSLHGVTSDPLPDPPLFANGNTISFAGGPAAPYNFVYEDGGTGYQTWAFTQTISGLTAGKTYELSFLANYFTENNSVGDTAGWTANLGGTTTSSGGQISFTGGQTESTVQTLIPQGAGGYNVPNGTGWLSQSLTFTATGTSEALSFLATGSGGPPFAAITDISLTAVPEPTAWVMMLVGVSSLGVVLRRRRAKASVAAAA
jgi:hypothetical protein